MWKYILLITTLQLFISTSKAMTVTCYYSSWAVYRPGDGKYDIEDLDPFICTHLIYSFIGINSNGTIRIQDPELDVDKQAFYRFNNLKTINPKLKTLVAIGGWNESPIRFSKVASDPKLRENLVSDVIEFLKKYGFDGLDFDWEYPTARGGIKEDKDNFSLLLKELKEEFKKYQFILTAAVAAVPKQVHESYNVREISKHLDAIHIMTYDLHSAFNNVTGENSPLYASTKDVDKTRNVNASIKFWIESGAPPNKIVMGIPSYGISYTVPEGLKSFGVVTPTLGPGYPGEYTNQSGMLAYYEICNKTKHHEWKVYRNKVQKVPYVYGDGQWVGYDDPSSVKEKMKFANAHQLSGVMVWSIDTDDFRGICGKKYPILNAMKKYSKSKYLKKYSKILYKRRYGLLSKRRHLKKKIPNLFKIQF